MLDGRKTKKLAEEVYPGKDLSEGSVDLNELRREGYVKAIADIKKKIKIAMDTVSGSSKKGTRRYEIGNGATKVDTYSYIEISDLNSIFEHVIG